MELDGVSVVGSGPGLVPWAQDAGILMATSTPTRTTRAAPRRAGGRPRAAPRRPPVDSTWVPLLVPPVVLCAASWALGGEPALTDAGFLLLAVMCLLFVLREVAQLSTTGRLAPLVLFGGVLIWFCQDYFANWASKDFRADPAFSAELIARVATMHCLFVLAMTIGLSITRGRPFERLLSAMPEPRDRNHYFAMVLVTFGAGLIPYVFFSRDSLLVTFERAVTGFYTGGASFTFGRTGNLNYDWSGYFFELIKVGRFGGLLAAFYTLMVATTPLRKAIGWGIWTFWLLLAFGSGTRGQLVFMAMPVLVFLLLRHARSATPLARLLRRRALLQSLAIGALVFAMMQVQGQLRSHGLRTDELQRIELTELNGNHMFSEGLAGWDRIPSRHEPFFDTFPGEGALRAIPETVMRIAIHPVPRALWTSKPVDPVWAWYNELVAGTTGGSGTTISTGLVGWWYFRYGLLGLLQGGLFMGWLLAVGDRALAHARAANRPMSIIVCLAFLAWVFRCFRDLAIGELYEVVVASVALAIGIRLTRGRGR